MPIWGVSPIDPADELMIMNRHHTSGLLAVLVLGVSALSVSANGFRLADQDAFATARGEAFVATADNASAIYYNPAGLTQLEGFNFRGGVYGIYLDPSSPRRLPPIPARFTQTTSGPLFRRASPRTPQMIGR